MILIDTNSLIILLLGLIEPDLLAKGHRRSLNYGKQDFYDLLIEIEDIKKLVVLPNVWTEVDNLLNNFTGDYRYKYIKKIAEVIRLSSEIFIASIEAIESDRFISLGLTDSLLLKHAKNCEFLITSDSELTNQARGDGIEVYNLDENRAVRRKR